MTITLKQPSPRLSFRPRRDWSPVLVAAVAAILKSYSLFHQRVGFLGKPDPGPLVIVANHGHDADSVVLPVSLALMRGIAHPLISSGSERLRLSQAS
ncbi:hypothetical protein [Sulfobacillus harzensis]|uniref:Uncharacterized protein n=1 Tax=Sulfobacillus harzensis TaxID=2729629 RepID=A0A7Y0L0J1_9FIRM|nr:hypothetical protein [Sulfobacillus harzensis]NMP21081.1 hypothetical protein [Sulfobacillus harzensis]